MKKIKYFILITIMFFSFFTYANATTCKYSDGKLTATFKIVKKGNDETKTEKAIVNGSIISKGKTKQIKNEKQKVENWTKNFKPGDINAIGSDYFKNNKKCPPYSIFVHRGGQYDLAVFSESHLDEFKKYASDKKGYAIMELIKEEKEPETDGGDVNHEGTSCVEYTNVQSCEENHDYFACIWNETEYGDYCNTDKLQYVQCGDAFDIPHEIPEIFSLLVNLLKIGTPIILIIVSIISLLKALSASSEDEIKKAQKSLIRKLIAAVMVFFVISIVQFVTMKVADTENVNGASEADNLSTCLTCFLNNDCENSIYYKTNVAGRYICTYLESGKTFQCKGNK